MLKFTILNPTNIRSHQLIFIPSFPFPLEQYHYITLYKNVNRKIVTISLTNLRRPELAVANWREKKSPPEGGRKAYALRE